MRSKRSYKGLGLALALFATACDETSVVCTTEGRHGLDVTVRDSVTVAPLLVDSLSLIARDGSFTDSIRRPGVATQEPIGLADERPGTYSLEVIAEGYLPWADDGLTVVGGVCHVETLQVEALLRPVPGES